MYKRQSRDCGNTILATLLCTNITYRIRNGAIREQLRIGTSIIDTFEAKTLCRYGHVQKRPSGKSGQFRTKKKGKVKYMAGNIA